MPADKPPFLKAILPEFVAKTRAETGNLFYEFTINGDEVFCREGYTSAEALLVHLENVPADSAYMSSGGKEKPPEHLANALYLESKTRALREAVMSPAAPCCSVVRESR